MPLSTAVKAALCVCPPALLAGTVATVPSVKQAVHHATAHRATPKALRREIAHKPAGAQASARQQVDCGPGFAGMPPAAPLLTYAAPIPDEPVGTEATPQGSGFAPAIAGIGIGGAPVAGGGSGGSGGGGSGSGPGTGGTDTTPSPIPSAVPEASTWLMLIGGVGMLGAGLRRRRTAAARRRAQRRGRGGAPGGMMREASLGGALLTSSAAVEAGDMAATMVVKSTLASAAGKALLCVCPAAVVAGSVMTIPPLREAVHAYTSPDGAVPAAIRQFAGIIPCVEPILPPDTTPLAGLSTVPKAAPTPISAIGEAAPRVQAEPTA